jgi:hypothetical protein
MPKNRRGVRRILGSLNFFRSLIPNFSSKVASLSSKVKDSVPFIWHKKDTEIVQSIISELQTAKLAFPDYSKPFSLYTDASDTGVGSILMQEDTPIYCFSRKLSGAQVRYTTSEKEALAIVWSLQHLRTVVFGQKLKIFTDHSNLQFLSSSTLQRIQRWKILIDEFKPEICYVPGPDNYVADFLSRLPDDNQVNLIDLDAYPLSLSQIIQAQTDTPPEPNRFLKLVNGVWRTTTTNAVYVVSPLRKQIIEWIHTQGQHIGCTKTYKTLHPLFYWPNMHSEIVAYINKCKCQKFKSQNKEYAKLTGILPNEPVFNCIGIDLQGPFDFDYPAEERYILSIIDHGSRWVELVALENALSETITREFENTWILRYPRPSKVVSDQGPQFMAKEFKDMLSNYGIKHVPTVTYNPTGNSICERIHNFINNALRANEAENLDNLQMIAWSLRATFHRNLGCSPGELIFGKSMIEPSLNYDVRQLKQRADILKTHNSNRDQEKSNKHRIKHQYSPGQYVYVKNEKPKKLQPRYSGPFLILSVNEQTQTVRVDYGNQSDSVSFRKIKPSFQEGG